MRYSTQYSHVVTDRSTDWAVTSLTLEIGRDPVLSGAYGRNIDINEIRNLLDGASSKNKRKNKQTNKKRIFTRQSPVDGPKEARNPRKPHVTVCGARRYGELDIQPFLDRYLCLTEPTASSLHDTW
jgi:hypothetical protein